MKLKLLLRPAIAALASLVLAGFVTAAASGSRTTSLAADGNNPTDRNITRITAGLLEHSQFSHHRLDDELAKSPLHPIPGAHFTMASRVFLAACRT